MSKEALAVAARRVLGAVVCGCLVAGMLAAQATIPGLQLPASATTPASPPAPVNPAETIQTVTASGPTTVSGTISTDTVWSPSGSPYVLHSTLTVTASLTLLPGHGGED
jgi:hypothetical protein